MTPQAILDRITAARPEIATRAEDIMDEAARERLLGEITSMPFTEPAATREPKARKPVYRRPITIAAALATAVAATLLITSLLPQPEPSPPVQDAAYVVNHLAEALTVPESVVHYTERSRQYVEQHWYRLDSGLSRVTTALADGTPCTDARETSLGPPANPDDSGLAIDGTTTETGVDYTSHTWWQHQGMPWYVQAPACQTRLFPASAGYSVLLNTALDVNSIKRSLAQGSLQVINTGEVVNGQPTIELDDHLNQRKIWINETTYRPVHELIGTQNPITVDFEFLPPTPANLSQLNLPIPPTFTQTNPPTQH